MCMCDDNLLHSGNDVKGWELEEIWMEAMAAVDKARDKEGAEAMKEDAIPAVGNLEFLFD